MSPIISIADFETHLHVIHATLQHLFSHINDEVISDWFLFQRNKSIWQRLGYMYKGHCFLIGCTNEFLVADDLPDVVKSWVDGLRIPFRDIGVRLEKLPLNHVWNLPATLQMHIRSPLGLTWALPFTHHPPFALELREVFVHPSQVTIRNGRYIFFIYSFWFLWVDNKFEQIELSIFNPSCRLIIIDFPNADLLTLGFYLGFLVYNNRLTLWMVQCSTCRPPFSRSISLSSSRTPYNNKSLIIKACHQESVRR